MELQFSRTAELFHSPLSTIEITIEFIPNTGINLFLFENRPFQNDLNKKTLDGVKEYFVTFAN